MFKEGDCYMSFCTTKFLRNTSLSVEWKNKFIQINTMYEKALKTSRNTGVHFCIQNTQEQNTLLRAYNIQERKPSRICTLTSLFWSSVAEWGQCECPGPLAVHSLARGSLQVKGGGVLTATVPWGRPHHPQLPLQDGHRPRTLWRSQTEDGLWVQKHQSLRVVM